MTIFISAHRAAMPLAVLAAAWSALPALGAAQSLRGSRASIERMYHHARAEHFSFFTTPSSVRRAVAAGYLVRLLPDSNFTLHAVAYPYVRPATLTFVHRLAAEYVDACGEPLVVTSAVRPEDRQPGNSTAHSVHPTGMAVDLRKPDDADCRRWLRSTLLELEDTGVLEATEEFAPPHFHVAVFPTPYRRYVTARTPSDVRRVAVTTYTVRDGDTLWDIAREHDTTVDAIQGANGIDDDDVIQPGQELKIPRGG
jgi:nucleoid-associated protein YgaU